MTENERFTLSKDKYETIFDNGTVMGIIDIVEKLNELNDENKSFKKQNTDYFNNINNLILDNMVLKNEVIALKKRDKFVRNYLYNNEHMSLEDYNKIVNVLYEELRNKVE